MKVFPDLKSWQKEIIEAVFRDRKTRVVKITIQKGEESISLEF